VVDRVLSVFEDEYDDVTDLAIKSIACVYDYLGLNLTFTKTSICAPETKGMDRSDRLIEITKKQGFKTYVNLPGGRDLYSKEYFRSKGIELQFVRSNPVEYKQYSDEFVPFLSIIDVLMFNCKPDVLQLLSEYSIE
jgi:hypothetical protein